MTLRGRHLGTALRIEVAASSYSVPVRFSNNATNTSLVFVLQPPLRSRSRSWKWLS